MFFDGSGPTWATLSVRRTMTLVRIAMPESESHLALMVSALEREEIPHFVHGAALGSLLPGLQIQSYNARSVMVPESCATRAVEVIEELQLDQPTPATAPTGWDKLRMVLEAFLLGWMVPGRQRRRQSGTPEH